MLKKKSIQLYLNESEIKVLALALLAYQDYCGEVIADYRNNENIGYTPTENETQDYIESLERNNLIRHILGKLH